MCAIFFHKSICCHCGLDRNPVFSSNDWTSCCICNYSWQGAISLGPVGAAIASAVGILGFPSLAGFTYSILQAVSNKQGVYLGVEMNGVFPNIVSGTY